MSEQEIREKVIKGLECCGYSHFMDKCQECPYDGKDCFKRLKTDTLALLKAQEPRVMTLEELVVDDVVWLEDCDKETTVPGIYCDRNDTNTIFATRMRGYLFVMNDEYGKRWRCWTSRPTDEQRRAVKWE